MFKPRTVCICVAVLVITWLTACQSAAPPFECTDSLGCVTIGPDEPIKIGSLHALSGGASPNGIDGIRGIELALADRDGEFLSHPIELQSEDSLCSEEGGTTAALKLVADPQIVALLGTTCSGAAVTAAKIMTEAGLVMISDANTAPSLTALGGQEGVNWQPGYFRTAHNDTEQGRAAATFAFQELGIKKAATINDGDTYTQGLTEVFDQVFAELGGEIVLDTAVNKGDTDMRPVLASVTASGAELVFLPIFSPESDFIALQAKEVEGFEDIILMSADASLTAGFLEATGSEAVGMYLVGPTLPSGSAYDAFVSDYKSKYGEAPLASWHATAYDATNLILEAIAQVAIQEEDGTLHVERQALRDSISATSGFQGLSGVISCDEFGDCGAAKFKVVRLDDPTAGIEGLVNNVIYTYTPEQISK